MNVTVVRIYDTPLPGNHFRVLVDRLWPRGVSKDNAHIDVWLKEITPSSELRTWFHEDKASRYKSFATKYAHELKKLPPEVVDSLRKKKDVTLVTAVKDIEKSHIPTLVSFLSGF